MKHVIEEIRARAAEDAPSRGHDLKPIRSNS